MTVLSGAASFFFTYNSVGKIVPELRTRILVWVAPFLFLAAGLIWLAVSFFWVFNAEETTGVVNNVYEWEAENEIEKGQTLYGPVFTYTWSDGQETSASLFMSGPDYNFEIGSEHTILFDPKTKGNVRFAGFAFNYLAPVIILGIGLMFTLISLVLWMWLKSIARKWDEKESIEEETP